MTDYSSMSTDQLHIRIAKLERTVQFLLDHLELTYEESPASLFPEVAELKALGKVFDAVSLYRNKTGASLAEAKEFVDSL